MLNVLIKSRKGGYKMDKRVYGLLGISSKMANWNADFTGYPKTTTSGDIFGSDKAFKYPMKRLWEEQGEKVLYIKSFQFKPDTKKGELNLSPRTLKERYEQIFGVEDLKKDKDISKVLKNLFTAIDVKNFGATFAEEGANISIMGAVQIGQGYNKYDESETQTINILSPFKDPKAAEKNKDGDDAKTTTLGTKIVSDEAHYIYPFSINSNVYRNYMELGVTNGYTEEDYQKFKKASLTGATAFSTNSKAGCENELGLFVETEADLYLPNFDQYVQFIKTDEGELDIMKLTCGDLLNEMKDRVKSIELYYNPYTTKIEHNIEKIKCFNIFTMQEM